MLFLPPSLRPGLAPVRAAPPGVLSWVVSWSKRGRSRFRLRAQSAQLRRNKHLCGSGVLTSAPLPLVLTSASGDQRLTSDLPTRQRKVASSLVERRRARVVSNGQFQAWSETNKPSFISDRRLSRARGVLVVRLRLVAISTRTSEGAPNRTDHAPSRSISVIGRQRKPPLTRARRPCPCQSWKELRR